MDFQVAPECERLGLRAGAILFRGVHVSERSPILQAEIADNVSAVRRRYTTPQSLRDLPEVGAFQALLHKVNVNPSKYQPSIERLLNAALKRGDLPRINNLVDAYNLVSVRSLCSLGAHDLDCIALPVSLRLFTGSETFTPLGRDKPEPMVAGEFGYVDAAGRVLCRLDVLQADSSKVTGDTKNALLIIEGTSSHAPERLQQAFTEATETVLRYCGGTAEIVANAIPSSLGGEGLE